MCCKWEQISDCPSTTESVHSLPHSPVTRHVSRLRIMDHLQPNRRANALLMTAGKKAMVNTASQHKPVHDTSLTTVYALGQAIHRILPYFTTLHFLWAKGFPNGNISKAGILHHIILWNITTKRALGQHSHREECDYSQAGKIWTLVSADKGI